VKYTLISDGSSDRALMPILSWALRQSRIRSPLSAQWADFRHLRCPPRGLLNRLVEAVHLYPCDLLFVHRDAEAGSPDDRLDEIESAISQLSDAPAWVPVVPVRMLEAWFLRDENAIRKAAGNPGGAMALDLPVLAQIERVPDPKAVLRRAILVASGLNRRRQKNVRAGYVLHRIAELCDDFSTLNDLPAFARFMTELSRVVAEHNFR